MFSYSDGMFVYEFGKDHEGDFLSDLSKALFGVRDAIWNAQIVYERFCARHPGETPIVFDGELKSRSELRNLRAVEAWRDERERTEKARRRREAREQWEASSPMAVALRKAGLAA